MNRQFYEFCGNFFTNVAQGQKQLEDMTAWMKQGFAGGSDLSELFRRCYGLEQPKADGVQNSQIWQKSIADFQQAFTQLAAQWGWVTQTEHQQVLDKCAALEEKSKQQQTTINGLRDLLTQEGLGHTELFQHLNNSLKEQSDQFHALMESINSAYKDKS